jgi:hypothetical protein
MSVPPLTQSLHRINARLHRLRQPIGQVSRLLTGGIVQMKAGDRALYKRFEIGDSKTRALHI